MSTLHKERSEKRGLTSVGELDGRLVLFRMTSDQFCELPPSDLYKLELLNGEVVMAARPSSYHQYFISELIVILKLWVKRRRLGRVLLDTLMKINDAWTPVPDICFIGNKHLKHVKRKRIEGLVDLAVEVLSPSNEDIDRETKFRAYADHGITWYWIIDLEKRTLEEYRLVGDDYGSMVEVSFDKPFKPRLFKGLTIDLASLEW
jgi:Uma2 family endonuclease